MLVGNPVEEKDRPPTKEDRPDFNGQDAGWTHDDKSVNSYKSDNPNDPEYKDLPNGGEKSPYEDIDLPPVPGGMDNPKTEGQVVSVEAMKQFGVYITQLIPAIQRAIQAVEKVAVRPGAFGAAWLLGNEINADGKFRDNTLTVLRALLNTILHIKEAVDAIAVRYKNAEDLNDADAKDLARMMSQVKSDVNGLKLA